MVDTVRYIQAYELRPGLKPVHYLGWKKTEISGDKFALTKLEHFATGLRGHFYTPGRTIVEVSLPRLLFKTNARLILTQKRLDEALDEADKLLRMVAIPKVLVRKFTRVDLVWQVRGKIEDFIAAHYQLPHPAKLNGKRQATIYQGESIVWGGTESKLTIYDKLQKMGEGKGNIARVELQLRGSKLNLLLGSGQGSVTKLDVAHCYEVLRDILWRFAPKKIGRIPDKHAIYDWAIREGWTILGEPAIDVFLREYKSKKWRREALRGIQRTFLRVNRIDWRVLMPFKMPRPLFINQHGCTFWIGHSKRIKFAKPKNPTASSDF